MRKAVRIIIIVLLLAGIAIFLHGHPDLSMQSLLDWQPPNPIIAAIVVLLCYAVKSITVVVPLILLQALTGHLFERNLAILINFVGLVIVMIIPYWLGRKKGAGLLDKLMNRYPKFETVIGHQHNNELFLCFVLRAVPVLPGDILTMYLGASGTSCRHNVIGGILGSLPTLILATILGQSISDPGSPAFWRSVGLNIAWVALSGLCYWLYKRHDERAEKRKEK